MSETSLQEEVQKRFTLNWLIQGAAQHAGMTLHHLVRHELEAVDDRLLHLYDLYALINLLQYWQPDGLLLLGRPRRFWRRAATSRRHPFYGHPLLARHGGMLAEVSRERAMQRAKEKGLVTVPFAFAFHAMYLIRRLRLIESRHRIKLMELAKTAASATWGISRDRLSADFASGVAATRSFGPLPTPRTVRGFIFRATVCGYGGVVRASDGRLHVRGEGTNWQLVVKDWSKESPN